MNSSISESNDISMKKVPIDGTNMILPNNKKIKQYKSILIFSFILIIITYIYILIKVFNIDRQQTQILTQIEKLDLSVKNLVSEIQQPRMDLYKINKGLDKFEIEIYDKIKQKLINNTKSKMSSNQREFLNGIIRKFKPKKILEIGVLFGGSSSIILNAINDFPDAHLYSIDIKDKEYIGELVRNEFSELTSKWTLFKGNVAAKFIENIGHNIDMVFIDTSHYEPGEILDTLMVLPFLSEEALIGFHDIAHQRLLDRERREWAPYLAFNMLRGAKYYPSWNGILKHGIGFVHLERNQKRFYYDYFRTLSGQWQYVPENEHLDIIKNLFSKYYDDNCMIMFDEAVTFNIEYNKRYPMEIKHGK